MEVTVLEATCTLWKPVLAIHAGPVRRQANLEVNKPFGIPHPGSLQCPVEVSVFEQLASQVLVDNGKAEAISVIPVRKPDGTASQVKLRVRRARQPAAQQAAAPQAAAAPPQAEGAPQAAEEPAELARAYLESHQLQQRVQTLIQDVLREQPQDPYRFMLSQLHWARAAQHAAQGAPQGVVGIVPVPPAGPPPSGTRKGSHGRHFSGVGAAANAWTSEDATREDGANRTAGSEASAGEQARWVRGQVYKQAAAILSPEYHLAVTRWAADLALLSACNIIGGDSEKRDACFDPDDETEFEPLPLPEAVVRLRAHDEVSGVPGGGGKAFPDWATESSAATPPSSVGPGSETAAEEPPR